MSLLPQLTISLPSPIEVPKKVLQRIKGRTPTKKTNSIALVANAGDAGCIIDWHGTDFFWELQGVSSLSLEDHGLDNAPVGLSIWEGYSFVADHTDMTCLDGTFRDLTPEEWHFLSSTGCPWELEPCDFCKKAACTCDDGPAKVGG